MTQPPQAARFDTSELLAHAARIYDLPFLSGEAKRQILGENARRLFRLTEGKTVALRRE